MSSGTKQRIIDAAIHLFNTHGLANVRLQQIADETGISVGNLAYHYKNKDAIVAAVYEQLFVEFHEILSQYLTYPGLDDFDQQLDRYAHFFDQHPSYLIDLFEIERSYPDIIYQWRQCVGKMLMQIRRRIDHDVQRGTLKPEPFAGHYNTLAENVCQSIVFWKPRQILRGKSLANNDFKASVWAHFHPYFTTRGLEEFVASFSNN